MTPAAVRYLLLAAITVSGLVGSAHACSICVAYPQQSAADVLIDSPCVVLAREDPDQPFSYAPIEVLRASDDVGQIDLLLDSQTRRILSSDPGRVVVLARDGKDASLAESGSGRCGLCRRRTPARGVRPAVAGPARKCAAC